MTFDPTRDPDPPVCDFCRKQHDPDDECAAKRHPFIPGCFDIPAEQYHAVEAMSAHGASAILYSPLHFRVMRDDLVANGTKAKDLGSSIHDGVLEPEHFERRIACQPEEAPKRPSSRQINAKKQGAATIEAIAFWRDFDAEHKGKIILSPADFERSRRCVDSVLAHPMARQLLAGAEIEQSLFWHDKMFDVPAKCRRDIVNLGGVIDLKSCRDASPAGFSRAIGDYSYHIQGWSNFSGAEHVLNRTPEFFAFIAVETEPPFAVACYQLGRDSLMAGARLWDEALARYKRALDSGAWAGYSPKIEPIDAPRYKLRFDLA